MRKFAFILLSLCFLNTNIAFSQRSKSFFKDKLEIGGGISAGFTNELLNLGISPILGIRLIPQLYLGLGFSYDYYYQTVTPKSHTNTFGISFLSRFLVFQGLYLQAEFDISTSFYKDAYNNKAHASERHLLLGAGYQQRISERLYSYFSVLWDTFYKDYPYAANPVFQAGIGYLF